jgi:uncharacterized protein (DUF927 family)
MDEIVKAYTKEDFLEGTEPFEEVYEKYDDKFELDRSIEKMADMAKTVGVKNFKTMFKSYCKKMKSINNSAVDNASDFEGQPMELNTGQWQADDDGITMINPFGMEITACVHPIMPIERLVNADTNIAKLKIAYRLNGIWRFQVVEKKVLASASSIIQLADFGIAVTSENSKYLVQYLHDVEYLNYDRIPESKSVGRLGWIPGEGFSPYMKGLIFDGEVSFRQMFEAVNTKGNYDKWLDAVKDVRAGDMISPRIQLAASFASVLVEPLHCLPFFVHLWGGSETGKTAGLLLATSVWADPEMGKYCQTFNSTAVAQELSAGFVNSMPLMLDELQLEKDRRSFDKMIYQLAEGVGRTRGAKAGGLQRTQTWRNCIITTGEQPLTTDMSGSGAVNRIIEINCEDTKLFKDPVALCNVIKLNYGYAGRDFVEQLKGDGVMDLAKSLYDDNYKRLLGSATEKQAMAAALILTADTLSESMIFKDGRSLRQADIESFLSNKEDIDQNLKALEWLRGWIVQNSIKFITDPESLPVEIWGIQGFDNISIIKTVFNKACLENGFNPNSFTAWLHRNGYTLADKQGKLSVSVRMPDKPVRCLVFNDREDFDDD